MTEEKEKTASTKKDDKKELEELRRQAVIDAEIRKIEELLRHLKNVHNACEILGKKLMEQGELHFGRNLISNAFLHDYSKFHGVEWEHLTPESCDNNPEAFKIALVQHQQVNEHHPEYWGGVNEMPRIYVAEMVCDWYARSVEMGTDLREFFQDVACEKYGMSKQGKKYKEVKDFIDLLLNKPFKSSKK